ncbi:MAG TPA: RNA-binding protein [Burkholderiales bacterium]|nr:RNA-binding protein [Burkholderiales bacterium]
MWAFAYLHRAVYSVLRFNSTLRTFKARAMVLELNLRELTLQQISEFIKNKCSGYGTVLSVSLRLFPIPLEKSFAVVEMASAEENARLCETVGDGYAADGVLVQLLHRDPPG